MEMVLGFGKGADMKWWGWLVVGIAATLMFIGGSMVLEGLGVLKLLGRTGPWTVGGLIIIWSFCIAAPLVLRAIKAEKKSKSR